MTQRGALREGRPKTSEEVFMAAFLHTLYALLVAASPMLLSAGLLANHLSRFADAHGMVDFDAMGIADNVLMVVLLAVIMVALFVVAPDVFRCMIEG